MQLRLAPGHAFLSHSTAGLVWGAPLPWRVESDELIHVGVPAPAPRLHSPGVVGHRLELAPADVTEWAGLRVTTPARTWLDLAAVLELDDLVAAGDYLIHHAAPFADRVELAMVLGRADGQRGVRLARRAIELLNERSESRSESRLRVILVTSGLPTFEITHALVETESGRRLRPDFLFRREQLILEYQGDYHRSRAQWRKDLTRRSRLEAQGWRVVELNADDLRDPAELVARIRALLQRELPQH